MLLPAAHVEAQEPGGTVTIRPGRDYGAGQFRRWVLGAGYRSLWSIEIPVPVLDLDSRMGGLTRVAGDTSQSSRILRLSNGDGREYEFIPVDFEPRIGLDPGLRASLAGDVLQDQVSSTLPMGGLVVSRLLEAADLPDSDLDIGVLPDAPALADYGDRLRGVVGQLREIPAAYMGGADSTRTALRSPALFTRLRGDPDVLVDQRALLRHRLFDVLVAEWNRHPGQWTWVGRRERLGGHEVERFTPVPGPRLWAFSRLDGLIQTVASLQHPQFVGFNSGYPPVEAMSRAVNDLDRRLLTELDSADFAAVTSELVRSLPDSVVHDAFDRLPDAYLDRVGADLRSTFIQRRDGLANFASSYYRMLARFVDLDGTERQDIIRLHRRPDGTTTVTIHATRDDRRDPDPWYRRTFHPSETKEVRVHAHAGDDRVEISGATSESPIVVRILGGDGDDRYRDGTSGRSIWVHDALGSNTFDLGTEATLDRSDWREPSGHDPPDDAARPRDWGIEWSRRPTVQVNPDDGLVLGVASTRVGHTFRSYPWEDRLHMRASIGTGTGRPNFGITYLTRPLARGWSKSLRGELRFDWRGTRADRFYGFGNDTDAPESDDRYRARRSELLLGGGVRLDLSESTRVTLGVGYRRFAPRDAGGTLVDEVEPYGYGRFDQVEAVATASWDRRDDPVRPRSGYRIALSASAVPTEFDVTDSYGIVAGVASTYLGIPLLPLSPTLAARVTGQRTLGTAPYFAYTSLGGDGALRGFRNQRYLGDASIAMSVELRGELAHFSSIFPGEVGLLGLIDTGRVWLDGESPGPWHTGIGGGIWASLIDQYALSLTVAKGEQWGVYFAFGMPF
ncbi:MAG TPA: BamA/TamA family outer membrane protein [Longimicrobiales bacterium]|nr:BamA/TamA family outer membrane protein [Longimicrobiales bacterium]